MRPLYYRRKHQSCFAIPQYLQLYISYNWKSLNAFAATNHIHLFVYHAMMAGRLFKINHQIRRLDDSVDRYITLICFTCIFTYIYLTNQIEVLIRSFHKSHSYHMPILTLNKTIYAISIIYLINKALKHYFMVMITIWFWNSQTLYPCGFPTESR